MKKMIKSGLVVATLLFVSISQVSASDFAVGLATGISMGNLMSSSDGGTRPSRYVSLLPSRNFNQEEVEQIFAKLYEESHLHNGIFVGMSKHISKINSQIIMSGSETSQFIINYNEFFGVSDQFKNWISQNGSSSLKISDETAKFIQSKPLQAFQKIFARNDGDLKNLPPREEVLLFLSYLSIKHYNWQIDDSNIVISLPRLFVE